MKQYVYKPKLNHDGTRFIDPSTNDFVNELAEVIDDGVEEVKSINWLTFKETLFKSALFFRALTEANPNAYSTLLKIIQDGENNVGIENNFEYVFNLLGFTLTEEETIYLNSTLESNNFTIRF